MLATQRDDGLSAPTLAGSVPVAQAPRSPLAPHPAGIEDHFRVQLPSRREEKAHLHGWWEQHRPALNLASMYAFYPGLRALQSMWEASNQWARNAFALGIEYGHRAGRYFHQIQKGNFNFLKHVEESDNFPKNIEYTQYADFWLPKIEATTFLSLAAANFIHDRKDLHTNLDLAVKAELGFGAKMLTFQDLRESNNPIVVSAVDRHYWQYISRTASASIFSFGLKQGVFATALTVAGERTVFYRPIAYDILKKAITDVQLNNLDESMVKNELISNLVKTLQQTRIDHMKGKMTPEESKHLMLTQKQIDGLMPTLGVIAHDIIKKRIGFPEAVYIMGGGVLQPDNPTQSAINYRHVQKVGVEGVAYAKQVERNGMLPENHGWRAKVGGEKHHVAESAKTDALLRQRAQLSARGPAHIGTSNDVGRGAGFGPM